MQNWDEKDKARNLTPVITLKKKQFERLLILVGSTGVMAGFAIYANFFNVC